MFSEEFNDSFDKTNPPAETASKSNKIQSVMPVCIRQFHNLTDDEFNLFGIRPQFLCLVVIIRNIEITSTKVNYKIEGHTGEMTAVLWLDNDKTSDQLPAVQIGRYCKIFGNLRIVNDVKYIVILKMQSVEDINEITTHLLEVIHARFASEKLSKNESSLSNIVQNNPDSDFMNLTSTVCESNASTKMELTPIQEVLYSYMKANRTPNGHSVDYLRSRFLPPYRDEVSSAIEYLSREGYIYSTIDDQHYKFTDA